MKLIYLISLTLLSVLFTPDSYCTTPGLNSNSELTEDGKGKLLRIWYDGSTGLLNIRAYFGGRQQELHVQVANSRGQFVAEETFILDENNTSFELDLSDLRIGNYRSRAYSTTAYGFTKFSIR